MAKTAIQSPASALGHSAEVARQIALVVGASLFVALCARITIPLMPLTPVPLTVQNLGVLLVGLLLGSRRGFAALVLYLAEGVVGLSVFNPSGPGGIAQLLGPTGGFLMIYPFVAFLAGFIFERGKRTFARAAMGAFLAEMLLFGGGLTWLYLLTHSLAKAAYLGLYFFIAAEVIKAMFAAAIAARWEQTAGAEFMTPVSEQETKTPNGSPSDVREITVAHSPDSDDAFMFYGLATHKVRTPGLRFAHTLCDIETLNQKARAGVYDVTAISFHAYPYVQDKYALMACGGSVGEGYGPMIVSPRPFTQGEVKTKRIAVPGTLTTAFLALQLFAPGVETEVVPFDQIIPQVLEGKFEAGLVIHEGQLTYDKSGLHRIVDLGRWWQKVTGLPLPLGGNAIRRALGPELMPPVTAALRESIQYALDHREEALAYAMQFARDLDTPTADKFVGMYVNERTLDYGPDGREAVRRLLDMGHKAGIIGPEARVDWV